MEHHWIEFATFGGKGYFAANSTLPFLLLEIYNFSAYNLESTIFSAFPVLSSVLVNTFLHEKIEAHDIVICSLE